MIMLVWMRFPLPQIGLGIWTLGSHSVTLSGRKLELYFETFKPGVTFGSRSLVPVCGWGCVISDCWWGCHAYCLPLCLPAVVDSLPLEPFARMNSFILKLLLGVVFYPGNRKVTNALSFAFNAGVLGLLTIIVKQRGLLLFLSII